MNSQTIIVLFGAFLLMVGPAFGLHNSRTSTKLVFYIEQTRVSEPDDSLNNKKPQPSPPEILETPQLFRRLPVGNKPALRNGNNDPGMSLDTKSIPQNHYPKARFVRTRKMDQSVYSAQRPIMRKSNGHLYSGKNRRFPFRTTNEVKKSVSTV